MYVLDLICENDDVGRCLKEFRKAIPTHLHGEKQLRSAHYSIHAVAGEGHRDSVYLRLGCHDGFLKIVKLLIFITDV